MAKNSRDAQPLALNRVDVQKGHQNMMFNLRHAAGSAGNVNAESGTQLGFGLSWCAKVDSVKSA